jgi:hypothetical protein
VTHPSLGAPPRDFTAGIPAAAAEIRAHRSRVAGRGLEIALEIDPTLRARYDDLGLRRLLHDAQVMTDRIADAVASNDVQVVASWAEQLAPLYRRRQVPMDDLVALLEGLRRTLASMVGPEAQAVLHAAIDEGIVVFRWHRRIGGDARRRNRILAALYKGA